MYQDGVKKCLLPAKILLQTVCLWPDDELPHGKAIAWMLFSFLFVTEIFHAAYTLKYGKDIKEAVSASITVTTTFEVGISAIIKLEHQQQNYYFKALV